MGLVIDTDVWVLAEKSGQQLHLARWAHYGESYINLTAGAHDALIAATALHYGHALLTRNVVDFTIFAGLKLEAFSELH